MGKLRSGLLAITMIALAGCGLGENNDPYALLDKAWSVGWERVEVQVGFNLDTPNTGGGILMPIPAQIRIDPSSISTIVDTHTGQWRVSVAIPVAALGMDPSMLGGAFDPGFQSIDLEALFDGTNIFVKSPLLPMYLESAVGASSPIPGDLTGWLKLGSAADLQSLAGAGNPFLMLPFGGPIPGLAALPIPTPGNPAGLRELFESIGVVTEYKGTEQRNGRDAHRIAAGLDIEKLAASERFSTLTGMPREQLQGLAQSANQFALAAELWFDKESGRLVGLQLTGQTLQGSIIKATLVVNLSEPADADPFAAPATFVDLPLKDLMEQSMGGGFGGGFGGGSVPPVPGVATPAPMVP